MTSPHPPYHNHTDRWLYKYEMVAESYTAEASFTEYGRLYLYPQGLWVSCLFYISNMLTLAHQLTLFLKAGSCPTELTEDNGYCIIKWRPYRKGIVFFAGCCLDLFAKSKCQIKKFIPLPLGITSLPWWHAGFHFDPWRACFPFWGGATLPSIALSRYGSYLCKEFIFIKEHSHCPFVELQENHVLPFSLITSSEDLGFNAQQIWRPMCESNGAFWLPFYTTVLEARRKADFWRFGNPQEADSIWWDGLRVATPEWWLEISWDYNFISRRQRSASLEGWPYDMVPHWSPFPPQTSPHSHSSSQNLQVLPSQELENQDGLQVEREPSCSFPWVQKHFPLAYQGLPFVLSIDCCLLSHNGFKYI